MAPRNVSGFVFNFTDFCMNYVYRYDPLVSHLQMHGAMLRAKRWNSNEDGWPHGPLLEAEADLSEGEAIFRISFWKSLEVAKARADLRMWDQMNVLQRVRADHPFLQTFERVDDDYNDEEAWLYWQTAVREPHQNWSLDGIPQSDIEILDLDGYWRPMADSMLMAASLVRYSRMGFQPHHYTAGRLPAVVYWSWRLVAAPSGEPSIALLIAHPEEHRSAWVDHDIYVVEHIVQRFLVAETSVVSARQVRVFILREFATIGIPSDLLEVRVDEQHQNVILRTCKRFLAWISRRNFRYEAAAMIDKSEGNWKWHALDSETGHAVQAQFGFLSLRRKIDRYRNAISQAHEDRSATMTLDDAIEVRRV